MSFRAGLLSAGLAQLRTLSRFFAARRHAPKKVRTCTGAGPPRHPEAAPGLVRRPADLDPERLVFIDETGRRRR